MVVCRNTRNSYLTWNCMTQNCFRLYKMLDYIYGESFVKWRLSILCVADQQKSKRKWTLYTDYRLRIVSHRKTSKTLIISYVYVWKNNLLNIYMHNVLLQYYFESNVIKQDFMFTWGHGRSRKRLTTFFISSDTIILFHLSSFNLSVLEYKLKNNKHLL